MYDPVTKRGVLNDFDLARWSAPDRQPNAKDNTGTLPFLALDLLNESSFKGLVRRLYRHDAESFTWCLIYACICMEKDKNGQIGTQSPHPLSPWFENPDSCFRSKHNLVEGGLLKKFPLHQNAMPLVSVLRHLWMDRFRDQQHHTDSEHVSSETAGIDGEGRITSRLPKRTRPEGAVQTAEPYEELSHKEWFKRVYQRLIKVSDAIIPDSKVETFLEMANLVIALYPYVDE